MARFTLGNGCSCAYELFPCSLKLARRYERETGHESVLFQTDWDYPGLAQSLGWRLRSTRCDHSSTDGTVICKECGKTAGEFIYEAQEWLDRHVGHSFNDPNGVLAMYFGW